MNKRILLIAYNFPPLISPQSLRWFYLSKELMKKRYKVDILTIKMPEKFCDILDMIPKEANVHRVFPGIFYYLTFRYSKESFDKVESVTSYAPSALWKMLSIIHAKTYRILNSFLIPDIHFEWFPFAMRKGLKLLKTNKYDIVISSSEPRICHLVGYILKKKSGIPWIADYGDPWIYPMPILSELKFKKKIMERTERNILKKVDALTVASDGIKELYLQRYPFLEEEKIQVVNQGFDPDIFLQVKGETSSKFRIVYCGSFYKKLRDPMAFFEAVREIGVEDIEVMIAGRINEFADTIKKENLSDRIKYHGFLAHKASLSLEKSAMVLLHVGNATDIQIPGKIYEYIGAGRPILCIKGGDNDVSADFIMRYNRGIVVENRKDDIRKGILEFYELWRKGLLDWQFDLDIIKNFSWQKSAEDIIHIMEKV